MKKFMTFMLCVLLSMVVLVSCGKKQEAASPAPTTATATPAPVAEPEKKPVTPKQADKTLVVAVPADFEEKWNPILAESAYDQQIMEQIFVAPQRVNGYNEPIDWGGSIRAENTADGGVLYTVTCKEGMYFSDGEPVTIDDFIYSFYLVCDPSYTGPITLTTEDIEGIKEYYYDNPNIAKVEAKVAEKYTIDTISMEDYITYMKDELHSLFWDDPRFEASPWGVDWVTYVKEYCGLPAEDLAEVDKAVAAGDKDTFFYYLAKGEVVSCWSDYDPSGYWTEKLNKEMKTGETVKEITGLKKVDDYTCTIKYNSVNIYGDRNVNMYFIPEHYYGAIEKGKVGQIQQTNMVPMGSGPYKWVGFADKIVTCVANTGYFEGVPTIGTVKWQYVPETDILASLSSGTVDIANPTGSKENIVELDSAGLAYDLVDFAGYGYCGFNGDNLPLNVRKGLWCLMSNRTPAVKGYYGKIADVIERPMTTVLAEYPRGVAQYYPYDLNVALDYFKKAGYTQKNGKLVDANGKQLVANAYIGGGGTGDHPTFAMLVQAGEDLKSLGGEIQIQDVPFNVLQGAMNDGTADIFILAWGNVTTCDKTSQFHTGGGQNRYHVSNARMDQLLDKIIVTIDLEERKALVAEMLDLAMDLCIELPVYQRKDIIAYNQNNINMATLPAETTTFWDYTDELWKLEMN